jgi:hypothetical protein
MITVIGSKRCRGARSTLGQQRGNDVARMEQDGFLFFRRDLDEAKSSKQENSFNSQQCVTDFMHIATFRSKRIEQYAVIASHWLQHVRGVHQRGYEKAAFCVETSSSSSTSSIWVRTSSTGCPRTSRNGCGGESARVKAPLAILSSIQVRPAAWNARRHDGRQNFCCFRRPVAAGIADRTKRRAPDRSSQPHLRSRG